MDITQLKQCRTVDELDEMLKDTTIEDLQDYLDAVEPARNYIELTMRDEFILDTVRRHFDKLVGNISDPIRK